MFKKSKLTLTSILSTFNKTVEELEIFQKEQEDLEVEITEDIAKLQIEKKIVSEDIKRVSVIKNNIKNLLK